MITGAMVDAAARALAERAGCDPDDPIWHDFRFRARAALEAAEQARLAEIATRDCVTAPPDDPLARVFYAGTGWYWQMEEPGCEPHGPFDSALEAGRAAREAIIANQPLQAHEVWPE